MNEFKIDMTDIVNRAKKEAQASFETQANRSITSVLYAAFSDGRCGPRDKEGLAHEIIRKKVEELILSEEFSKMADEIVAKVAPEEIERAARALVNSKARKHLFQPTSPNEFEHAEPEERLWEIQWYCDNRKRWDNNSKTWTQSEDYTLYNGAEKETHGLPSGGVWKPSSLKPKGS